MDNPLANSTLYPYDHLILKNYELGTLSEFADSYNIAPEVFEFQNTSVIMGIPGAWEKWATGFCDRLGYTAFGTDASLDWVCMSLTTLWPVDCGRQIDPRTNVLKRYCAVREEYCNVFLNDSAVTGSQMRSQDIPPLLKPVDKDLSLIDPTCGPNLKLSSYVEYDRFGPPQTDLNLNEKFIDINDQMIRIEATDKIPLWFNGGKTAIDFSFEWDIPSAITLFYKLELCSGCVGAIMEVFIYPLNRDFNLPDLYISYNVSMVKNTLTLISVEFIVTILDTGSYTIEGEIFPLRVFKGIGFKFHNIDPGSSITLYNPVVTTNITRYECTERKETTWYEPLLRVNSRAPDRFCVLTEQQVDLYPGTSIGECYCGEGRAGSGCDCIATESQFGEPVCGGFGDAGKLVLGPDNVLYTTGVGEESGCYVYSFQGKKYPDCKNVNLGTWMFTLWVPYASFDYPSVYVDYVPAKDVPFFRFYEDNTERETYEQGKVSCQEVGMYMPYYQTVDDLNQLLVDTRGRLPVFMGVDTAISTPEKWPWEKDNTGFFLSNPQLTYMSEQGTCNPLVCGVVNFNNFAFTSTITPSSTLTDGNTLVRNVPAGTYEIVWSQASELVVTMVFFGDMSATFTIDCEAGLCEPILSNGIVKFTECRCPGRFMSLTVVTSNLLSEIQIFNAVDTIRSSSYIYT